MNKIKFARALLGMLLAFFLMACGSDGEGGGDGPSLYKAVPPLSEDLLVQVVGQGVPGEVAMEGFKRFERVRHKLKNGHHLALVDFTQHSGAARFYVIDTQTGEVTSTPVAHGVGSDPDRDGVAQLFSNVPNSRKSSLGAYRVGEKYFGKYGASMRTDGLEASNSLVRRRHIVIHPSDYVKEGRSKQGMSWGCFALPYSRIAEIISQLKDGAFLYAHGSRDAKEASRDVYQTNQILLDPTFRWLNEETEAPVDGEF